jgi:hypothetical protein
MSQEPQPGAEGPAPATRPRRTWLWALGGLGVLVAGAFAALIIYNQQFRLTRDSLDAARARWTSAGIHSYDIDVNVSGATTGRYHVEVRNGKIVRADRNDQPFDNLEQARPWIVPELFNILEADLDNDAAAGRPNASGSAEFDPSHGHLIRYSRKHAGGSRRIQLHVCLKPIAETSENQPR